MKRIKYLLYAAIGTILAGSLQTVNAQYVCEPDPPAPNYKKLIIDAQTLGISQGKLQYANNDSVWIVVENVNPFVSTYTLKVKRTAVTETAIASFLGEIGGVITDFLPKQSPNSQQPGTTPQPAQPSGPPPKGAKPVTPPPVCSLSIQALVLDKFNAFLIHRQNVVKAIAGATTSYTQTANQLQKQVAILQAASKCLSIQNEALKLQTLLAQVKSPDELEASAFNGTPTDQDPIQVLQNEVSKLISEAKDVRRAVLDYRRQVAIHPECDGQLQANTSQLQEEETFMDTFLGPADGLPESQTFQNQLITLKTKYGQFTQARNGLSKLFDRTSSGNPFTLTKAITDSQADDEITLEVGPAITVISGPANINSVPPASAPSKTTTTPTAAFDTTIHFGYGPRFGISGGIVTSFLQNRQFTTANGQIAYQNNSRTRISPIAMLNSRVHDCDPDDGKCLWIPQISLGITAKADDKGTSPEFLIGPSWAFIGRQLFITVGAYAGQQQRLLGGLTVGQTTTLSAANLPVAKEYHWSGAIAITWKLK